MSLCLNDPPPPPIPPLTKKKVAQTTTENLKGESVPLRGGVSVASNSVRSLIFPSFQKPKRTRGRGRGVSQSAVVAAPALSTAVCLFYIVDIVS